MGTKWTDESAILRDLSLAQGRWVPGGIDSAVAGAKPPAHNITEETEEEYYRHWSSLDQGGTGDISSGPDLYQIKTMLELMQDEYPPNEECFSGPIEIRKLNAHAPHFIPTTKKNTKVNKAPNKPRRARNVAIASILALSQEPLKLAKPEDFMKPSKEDEEVMERRKDSVNKVTNWLQSRDITSMFKRKSPGNSFKEVKSNSIEDKSPVHSNESIKSSHGHGSVKFPHGQGSTKSPNGQYTPSPWAEEYYRKAVERSHVRDLVQTDVWGRAEQAMKVIDTRKEEIRKQEAAAELAAEIARQCEALENTKPADPGTTGGNANMTTSVNEADEDEAEGIAKVLLPKSRHLLYPGDACIVCKVMAAPDPQENTSKSESGVGKDHRASPMRLFQVAIAALRSENT
ncbi:uncharacterized protein LOC134743934 [Cydia strobilella]|uniref:uncharacterized protein LOC134743934 n=1 Tax=Cydia strobilella TaxID=1100964 RepID=UPI003007BBEE